MNEPFTITERTRVHRKPERSQYDAQTIYAVIDSAFFATIAFGDGKDVHAIPTAVWRHEDHLYIHGSKASRMLNELANGRQVCVSITHVDALVLARSVFAHSINYRSVCVYGVFSEVPVLEKEMQFQHFLEHWAPGRWNHARTPSEQELAATAMLRIPLTEAVFKGRQGPVKDLAQDMNHPVWAGLAPLGRQWLELQQDSEQTNQNLPGSTLQNLSI
jgi:nitroimidazol reductase NimA-like FMN-containing flavoprotein (pyridoxamine 5'-phosphate oxidase superfamily)